MMEIKKILEGKDQATKLFWFWSLLLLFASFFLSRTHYVSESNDSRFYSEQVEKYYNRPWQEIIAPKWGNNYGFDPNSYMRDQFPGQMLMGVGLAKLGVTPRHSLHIIEMIFQVMTLFLFYQIAISFIKKEDALVLFYTLLLIPNAFAYNLRANHESGITFFAVLSLYIGLKIKRDQWIWLLLSLFTGLSLLLIKGPFVLFFFILFVVAFVFRNDERPCGYAVITLVSTFIITFLALIAFEKLFQFVTGESFLKEFYRIQFKSRALDLKAQHSFFIQKALNFFYYFHHCLSYALPWTLPLFIIVAKNKFNFHQMKFFNSSLARLLFYGAISFCAVFSLSERIAGRYCYPAYYIFSAYVVLALYFNWASFRAFHVWLLKKYFYFVTLALWLMAFLIHFNSSNIQ